MQGCIARVAFQLVAVLGAITVFTGEAAATDVPVTWRGDAALHDAQFVGSQVGIAVGAHGAVWKTGDGGLTWTNVPCPTNCSLQSACFLTDKIGWVAGSETSPFTGQESGVLLATQDGGQTWRSLSDGPLPPIIHIKFFGTDEGVMAARATSHVPSGVMKTADGGKTWTPVDGVADGPWRTACFIDPEMGFVAGSLGRLSLVGGEQLFASKLPAQGLRSIRAIKMGVNDSGWLAGDGGLLLRTTNGGIVWDAPRTALPEELRTSMDFRAVEMRGESVWLAGAPGSVIWHSANAGQTWQRFLTGQSTPINSIRFMNDAAGIAVGELGVVLRTEDGGRSWQAVRGKDRRVALLSLQTRPSSVSPAWLAKQCGELGYRGAVWIANRQDIGPDARAADLEATLKVAIERSGGNAGDTFWQLPVAIPGLEFSSDKLIADWQKRTEGKLAPLMVGVLVRQIRTWRPSVVILDQPARDDAAGQLLLDASLRALEQAADSTRYIEQRELTGLAPWKVERVYLQLPPGSAGDVAVDLDEYLPRRKLSVRMASTSSEALIRRDELIDGPRPSVRQLSFRRIGLDGRPEAGTGGGRDFFAGLSLAPGSDARRELEMIDEADMARQQKLVQRHRNFQAIADQSLDNPRMAGQMIGQLGGLVRDMEASQGAELLRGLAEEYRERSLFELVEATNLELIRRYPQEPAAQEAMGWLFQFWISSETAWQRMRRSTNETSRAAADIESNARVIQQVADILSGNNNAVDPARLEVPQAVRQSSRPGRLNRVLLPQESEPALPRSGRNGQMSTTVKQDWRRGELQDWLKRAGDLASQLEQQSPALFHSPEIQFPLASLRRQTGNVTNSDAIFRSFLSRTAEPGTRMLAEREVWLMFPTAQTPRQIAACQRAEQKPRLDGVLADPCWQDSRELRLTSEPIGDDLADPSGTDSTLVMLSYDDEFLYVGMSVPRRDGAPLDRPQSGRDYDSDLSRHDRISICLDVDRDYGTWYEFQVDQRGFTSESCWQDRSWNPAWYVAADADEAHWRIEAAIPWNELSPRPPQRGDHWGVSISRTTPTVGMQSWLHPPLSRPRPASFGLLKFD